MKTSAIQSPREVTAGRTEDTVSPERIAELVGQLSTGLSVGLKNINEINSQTRLLSLNARMEASRAHTGDGAAFGVIATAMGELAIRTDTVARDLGERSMRSLAELERVNLLLGTQSRGVRLSDLALTNIDLIDRNLYERTCDVRWWATDPSVVEALTARTTDRYAHASQRLGVILDSYTVYFDLVLCDTSGTVVANGRPQQYRSVGTSHANTDWFSTAMTTRSGAEFGFESVHESPLVSRRRSLVYSAAVRANGDSNGTPIGVLGVVFNWDGLAQTVVEQAPLSAEERKRARVCLCDSSGQVLADTHGRQLRETISIPGKESLFQQAKSFTIETVAGKQYCYAHARSPGFETYATGWHSLIVCEL